MQVEIAAVSLTGEETWPGFIAVSRWFPVAMMALILLVLVVLPSHLGYLHSAETGACLRYWCCGLREGKGGEEDEKR